MDKPYGKHNYFLSRGIREHTYFIASLALAEIHSKNPNDYIKTPKGEVTEKLIEYLIKQRKSTELEDIKRRLDIRELKNSGAYDKLSFDVDFQLLVLRTITQNGFEFKKTSGIQPYAREWANNLEKIVQSIGLERGGHK